MRKANLVPSLPKEASVSDTVTQTRQSTPFRVSTPEKKCSLLMYKEQNKSFHYGIILIVNCSKICNAKVQYFSQSTEKTLTSQSFQPHIYKSINSFL